MSKKSVIAKQTAKAKIEEDVNVSQPIENIVELQVEKTAVMPKVAEKPTSKVADKTVVTKKPIATTADFDLDDILGKTKTKKAKPVKEKKEKVKPVKEKVEKKEKVKPIKEKTEKPVKEKKNKKATQIASIIPEQEFVKQPIEETAYSANSLETTFNESSLEAKPYEAEYAENYSCANTDTYYADYEVEQFKGNKLFGAVFYVSGFGVAVVTILKFFNIF